MNLDKTSEFFTYEGYRCLVIFQDLLGHFCGYVDVGPDFDASDIKVHGGVSFDMSCSLIVGHEKYFGRWVGFDCAHHGDAPHPDYFNDSYGSYGSYRDKDYVIDEIKWIVNQVKNRKLNPCPFCGSEDVCIEKGCEEFNVSIFGVRCNKCNAFGPDMKAGTSVYEEDVAKCYVVKAWNERFHKED